MAKHTRVSGQVRSSSGAPVTNTEIGGRRSYVGPGSGGTNNLYLRTDDMGSYFALLDEIGTHIFTVSHGTQVATSQEIVVTAKGEDVDGVDLVLAEAVLPPGETAWIENPANGHRYRAFVGGNWLQCHYAALDMGVTLATITSGAESQWLAETFGVTRPYWIGLTDARVEGEWRWVTGEPLEYTNWGRGEPSNQHEGGENYAHTNWAPHLGKIGLWNDLGPNSGDWHTIRHAILEDRKPKR